MAYSMFSEEVSLVRETPSTIKVRTIKPLTDDQMEDLYWAVSLMYHSNQTLKDILKKGNNSDRV